tara:strand:+ start:406 stop:804 length:399 start_codon:yes stop_codon:yes gene_type:complete
MKFNELIPIGTKIKVDKTKIKNYTPEKVFDNLPQIINGEVIDYKMTDGMGIGYVLKTEKNLKVWIFSNELDDQTKKEYKIETTNDSQGLKVKELLGKSLNIDYEINGNRDIKTIANPLNLFSWLIFTIKDIF